MSQLSTELQAQAIQKKYQKKLDFIDNIDPLLTIYLIEADESKLEALALLLVDDELPRDPVLHALYYFLQEIKEEMPDLFKFAQECIIEHYLKKIVKLIETSVDFNFEPYLILVRAHCLSEGQNQFRISIKNLNKFSARQAQATGLALYHKDELIVTGREPLTPFGWVALQRILYYSKITRLEYHSSTNDVIPNYEAFEKVLSHLTLLSLTQSLLESFTPNDWQLFREALSKSKIKIFNLCSAKNIPPSVLRQDQLQALANALSSGQVSQFSLMNNDIGLYSVEKWKEFGNAFSQCKLTSLNLSLNKLGSNEELKWEALLTATLSKNNITYFNLAQNNLGELSKESWEIFAKSLSQSKVTHLDLSDNGLNTAIINSLDTLVPILAGSKVTDLNLSGNNLHELRAAEWQKFWLNFLSQSNVIRLNLRDLNIDTLSPKQWQIFCDIIRDSKVRVVTLEKPAAASVVHETRSKELSKVLTNKKGTLAGLIRLTLWNVCQMKVKQADTNSDNNNPLNKSIIINFEKDDQLYETTVDEKFSEVLGEPSDYTTSLRYM